MIGIELPHGEVWVVDPVDVEVYKTLIGKLWESAIIGDDARRLLAGLHNGA